LDQAKEVQVLNQDGKWEQGIHQRAFVYDDWDLHVIFLENDAWSQEIVKFKDLKEPVQMHPQSSLLIVNGEARFDSAVIDETHMKYE